MEIPLLGEYTKQDVKHAIALDQGPGRRVIGIAYSVVAVLFVASEVVVAVVQRVDLRNLLQESLPVLIVLGVLGIAFLVLPWLQLRMVQRMPLFRGTVTGVADDEALVLRTEELERRVPWSSLVRREMSPDLVLLYEESGAFRIVPRRFAATEGSWLQFRDHVADTLPARQRQLGALLRWLVYALILGAMGACAILSVIRDVLP